jgi:hypothetical protein
MQHAGFEFRSLNDDRRAGGTCLKLRYESIGLWPYSNMRENHSAHFRGALLQLFGLPLNTSSLSDEAFDYIIEARDMDKSVWILTAYEGPSGPAIGGKIFDETCYPAAYALLNLIAITKPVDFEATIHDDDTDNTVTYGVKDGQAFHYERRGEYTSGKPD